MTAKRRATTSAAVFSVALTIVGVWLAFGHARAQAQQTSGSAVSVWPIDADTLTSQLSGAAQLSPEETQRVRHVLTHIATLQREHVERVSAAPMRVELRERLGREAARELVAAAPAKAAAIRAYLKSPADDGARALFAGLDRDPRSTR